MSLETGRNRIQQIITQLREMQEIERSNLVHATQVMERSDNPLVRQLMDISAADALQRHKVCQFIIDSLTTSVELTPEELELVWQEIESYHSRDRNTIQMAKELRDSVRFFVQNSMLEYLVLDAEKEDKLLDRLEDFKKLVFSERDSKNSGQ
jgi:hypothetical protein